MSERQPDSEKLKTGTFQAELERALRISKEKVAEQAAKPVQEAQAEILRESMDAVVPAPLVNPDSAKTGFNLDAEIEKIQAARKARREAQADKKRSPEPVTDNHDLVQQAGSNSEESLSERFDLVQPQNTAPKILNESEIDALLNEKASEPTRQEMLDFLNDFPGHTQEEKDVFQLMNDEQVEGVYSSTKAILDLRSEFLQPTSEQLASVEESDGVQTQSSSEHVDLASSIDQSAESHPEPIIEPSNDLLPVQEAEVMTEPVNIPDTGVEEQIEIGKLEPATSTVSNPETQRLIERVEKAIADSKKPRITFANPNDPELRKLMLERLKSESESPEWAEVGKLQTKIERAHGIQITLGSTTPDRHIIALNSLEEALKRLNPKHVEGKSFVVGKDGEIHDKNLIIVDPDVDASVMVVSLSNALNPAPWKRLEEESKTKPKVLEGLDAQYRVPSDQVVATEWLDLPLRASEAKGNPEPVVDLIQPEINIGVDKIEPPGVDPNTIEVPKPEFERNTIVTVKTDKIPVGDSFTVKTSEHTYKLERREDGLYISGDPAVCPEPVKCLIDPIVRRDNPFRYRLEGGTDLRAYYSASVEKIKADKYPDSEPVVEAPEVKPEPEVPPLNPDELKEKLDVARKAYVVAKRKHDDFNALRTLRDSVGINLKGKAQDDAEKSLVDAKAEYEKARIEFLGADIERHLTERRALVSSHLDEYRDLRSTTERLEKGLEKIDKAWKFLGTLNVYDRFGATTENRATKAILKSGLSARTAISLLMLGGGIAAGAGTAVGASAFAGRRMLSGISTTFGIRDMMERVRAHRGSKEFTAEQIAQMTNLNDVQGRIAQLESRAFSKGINLSDIEQLPEYALLASRHKELLEARIAGLSDDAEKSQFLENRAAFSEIDLINAKKKEQGGRRGSLVAGLVAGAVVGGGGVNKALSYFSDGQSLGTKFRNLTNGAREELTHSGKSTGAYLEYKNNEAIVHAGNRGLEGSLQDLKAAEPETYTGMMKWIRGHYQDIQSSDNALIHKIVSEVAEKNGYTVDGVENDLSQVDAASLKLKQLPNGEFTVELDKKSVDLVGEEPVVKEQLNTDVPKLTEDPRREENFEVINKTPETPPTPPVDEFTVINNVETLKPVEEIKVIDKPNSEVKIGPESIEPEKLDFEQLKPTESDATEEVSSEAAAITKNLEVEKALQEVQDIPKTSDALEKLLGKDFKKFRADVYDFDGRRLNKIQTETAGSFSEFFTSSQTSPQHKKGYKRLYNSLEALLNRSSEEQKQVIFKGTIREMLMRLATERLKR